MNRLVIQRPDFFSPLFLLSLFFYGLLMCLPAMSANAQYQSYSAPQLIAEYRKVLVDMDAAVKALDKNGRLAEKLRKEKSALDRQSAEIDEEKKALEELGMKHNAEVAEFNAECIDTPVTDPEEGTKCNSWSKALNERNLELTDRSEKLSLLIEDHNARVKDHNEQETDRAKEAADLDRRYDEYERNLGLIQATLASMKETSDISRRCAGYSEPETRQRCMQKFWDEEN